MSSGWELQLDHENFLGQHWQREPLLIPGGIADFKAPLDADELAGLALDNDVESRIVEHRDNSWTLLHGPFAEADFQRDVPWTLLVQAVDHYLPEVAALRHLVDFIPQWRVDDVMVSYSVDGGGVGPHFDNYDVFLLQGEGERLWRLGQYCDSTTALLPHDELRILRDFECTSEYLLRPGDMLYVPPRIAHWGIAQGECTTFSIGLRAPRVTEMVSRWVDQLLEQLDPEDFYSDGRLEPAVRPGEIRPRDLERVTAQLQAALDQGSGNHWFGELVSEPKYEGQMVDPDEAWVAQQLDPDSDTVKLDSAGRLFWQHEAEGVAVFANGLSLTFGENVLPLVEALCGRWRLDAEELRRAVAEPEAMRLLDFLLDCGCIYVEQGNG